MESFVIPLVALLIPIIIVPTAMGFKHARLLRELKHAERMRAMELGRTLPEDEPWWSPSRLAAGIGLGVPLGSLLVALMVASDSPPQRDPVWVAAGIIGLGGVIGGTLLAGHQITARRKAEATYPSNGKPVYDPDAFDVVSSRG